MALRVFVSSTCKDLGSQNPLANCRECAIQAITNTGCEPVAMERWVATHMVPVAICRQKLLASTHYLGIFAHRRGAPHPELDKSMTEAEYDWAVEMKKPVGVLLPNQASPFNLDLETLAGEQTDEERDAQQGFLERVRSAGGYTQFDNPGDLASKVTLLVVEWRYGSLSALADAAVGSPKPTEKPILIGRGQHLGHFYLCLSQFITEDVPRAGAFLVHGGGGSGHDAMVAQLLKTFRDTSLGGAEPEHVRVGVKPTWRENSLARLYEVLGLGATHEAVAAALREKLEEHDVVLDFSGVQRFEGELPGFVNSFWSGVAALIPKRLQHRLIALLRSDHAAPDEWDAALQALPAPAPFDPARPLKLPELVNFTRAEVVAWLRGKVPDAEVDAWADTLMDETGGQPQTLFNKIRSEIEW
ncbi:MAG TPA: DUF4062 domain-containing protein [Pyrinomonadaceae bacterium]|nr:DUF4062 domain-containing protein [Pyrinomonadaceae bacterium]